VSARRFAALVLVGVALIQAVWIAVLPPFRGSDEVDHAYRAAAVAHGQWVAGPYATAGRGRLVTVPADIAAAASAQCWDLPYTRIDNCFALPSSRPGMVQVASSAATYDPAFYWVIGTVARPFHGAEALYAMRIATASSCALLIGLAAWCLGLRRRTSWRVLGLLLALTPVAVYSTAVAAPNGPEIAAGLLLWCSLLALAENTDGRRERALLTLAGLAATLLCFLRGLGPGFLVVTVGLCVALAPRAFRALAARRRLGMLAITLAGIAALGWHEFWSHQGNGGVATFPDKHEPWKLDQPPGWVFGTVAAFPFRNQPAPSIVYIVFFTVFVSVLVVAFRVASSHRRRLLAVAFVGVLAMPFVLTAVSYSSHGVIWQGRYGLPLAVGVPLLAVLALEDAGARRGFGLGFARLGSVLLALVAVPCLVHVRGMEVLRSVSTDDPSWHPPSIVLVAALVVVSALCWAAAGARPRDETPRAAPAPRLTELDGRSAHQHHAPSASMAGRST
jgi:hypothetical protein